MIACRTRTKQNAPTHTCYCETGFTLLEVLVAMVVLSMIVTTAFGSLRMGERSWEAGHKRSSETETLRTVAGVLQRQFNQILPLRWTVDAQKAIAFKGSGKQLSFIAPAPQHHGSTGLFEYTLAVEPHDDNSRLVLYFRLHDPDSDGFAPGNLDRQRVLLVDELAQANFDYYGSSLKGDPAEWHSQWEPDAELFPKLVQLRLVANTGKPWPELNLVIKTQLVK